MPGWSGNLRGEAPAVHLDLVDLDLNEALAMALQLLILLLALVVEHKDLVPAAFTHDGGEHLGAAQLLLEAACFAANRHYVRELQRAVLVPALLNLQGVARGHTVLLATC